MVKEKWNNIRSCHVRSKKKQKEWNSAPSGSAAKRKAKPHTYKYSAELYFLDEVEAIAETEDTLGIGTSRSTPSESLFKVDV